MLTGSVASHHLGCWPQGEASPNDYYSNGIDQSIGQLHGLPLVGYPPGH